MVRAIVGTLIEVGCGNIEITHFKDIIDKRDRSSAGFSVPANALFLVNIEYFTNKKLIMVDNEANERKTGDIIDLILLKRVLTFARPYKIYFYLAAIAAISLSFLGPIRPLLINHAVDNYIIIPDKENLLKITILLLVLLFLKE